MIGKSISAGPSVYITSADGFAEHKTKLMKSTTEYILDFQKISQGPFKNIIRNFSC